VTGASNEKAVDREEKQGSNETEAVAKNNKKTAKAGIALYRYISLVYFMIYVYIYIYFSFRQQGQLFAVYQGCAT
jgi:hypothetical protein